MVCRPTCSDFLRRGFRDGCAFRYMSARLYLAKRAQPLVVVIADSAQLPTSNGNRTPISFPSSPSCVRFFRSLHLFFCSPSKSSQNTDVGCGFLFASWQAPCCQTSTAIKRCGAMPKMTSLASRGGSRTSAPWLLSRRISGLV